MNAPSLAGIIAAPPFIDPLFLNSASLEGTALDATLGCRVVAKIEIHNPVGSFKGRGTELFAAKALSAGESVVCASAGNFGQGLARAAVRRGHSCVVFAARNANPVKVAAMRRFGAEVHLVGADFDAAKAEAQLHAAREGLRFVEDGVDVAISEGAGTIALETAAAGKLDAILVPLGNGALLAGVAAVIRELTPDTRIIAVVARNAPAMKLSLEAGRAIQTSRADTSADGIAVREPIPQSIPLLRQCCDDIVAVPEELILPAMRLAHRCLGLVLEPAGAIGIAAIMSGRERFAGQRIASILTGGNVSEEMRQLLLLPASDADPQGWRP